MNEHKVIADVLEGYLDRLKALADKEDTTLELLKARIQSYHRLKSEIMDNYETLGEEHDALTLYPIRG